MSAALKHLFEPIQIGTMPLKNRIVMSPMTTDYGTSDQEPSARLIEYLEARAKGGVGLITVEVCTIDPIHRYMPHSMCLGDDRFIEAQRKLTDAIHGHGAKAQPQITHPGPESLAPFFEQVPSIGPSVCTNPGTGNPCRQLEAEEISEIVEQYGEAARRAMEAGYDGMELHAAHCYMLLGAFLSPWRNKRRDEYAGHSTKGRTRFLVDVIKRMKEKTDGKLPLTLRISSYERTKGGRDINDTQRIAPMLVEAGVDAFHVSGGGIDTYVSQVVCGNEFQTGYNTAGAEAIKRVVDVPVMVVGRVHDPHTAERILADQQADLVVFGRPFLADEDWPNKAREGRFDDIRRCISCETCIDALYLRPPALNEMNCAVNARTGRELTNRLTPAERPKKVVVIGGGPGGMEAARVAATRGHEVVLLEKNRRLGGALFFASVVHSDNEHFLEFLTTQVQNLPIDLRLGTEATVDIVRAEEPDVVIVATGAQITTPPIAGDDLPHVFTGTQMRAMLADHVSPAATARLPWWQRAGLRVFGGTAQRHLTPGRVRALSRKYLPVGNSVAIIGADLAAVEVAEFLASLGRKVSILTDQARLAPEIGPKRRTEHMDHLDDYKVVVNSHVRIDEIQKDGVRITSSAGHGSVVEAESVIIAGEPVADEAVFESMQGLAPEVYAIGDCTGLGLIRKATADAMEVACKV